MTGLAILDLIIIPTTTAASKVKAAGFPAAAQFDTLSMGMTADLEAAIRCGSTMVRVGTAIFGKR